MRSADDALVSLKAELVFEGLRREFPGLTREDAARHIPGLEWRVAAVLCRPDTLTYHAGPWPTEMRLREAMDADRKPTGRFMFFDCFLWWSSVEARIRVEMTRPDGWWGCRGAVS